MTKDAPRGDSSPMRSRMSDTVYQQLQEMLVDGIIAPGARISVDAVSRRLGVSQTPVRESLNRLEAEDLVTKTHLIGYSATPKLTPGQFEDLFEARFLIEPYCAGLAANRHQQDRVEGLSRLVRDMRAGYQSGEMSYGAFAKWDAEFHQELVEATGNSYFREVFAQLHCHLQLFRLLRDSRVTADALDEHDRIVLAVRRRDPQAATTAMAAHLDASRGRLRAAFGKPPSPADPSPATHQRR